MTILQSIFSPITGGNNLVSKKLILLGASLEEGMKTGLQELINSTYGVNWTVIDLATSGNTSTDVKNRVDADLNLYGEEEAYVLVHVGGNDVSNTRPYSNALQADKDIFASNIDYIFNAIRTRGMTILPCNLSFRDYDNMARFYEDIGSKPYNDNILLPKIDALNSNYVYEDGTPFLDLYMFVKTNMQYLADDVHLTPEGYALYRQFVIDTVVKKIITGVSPTQLPALPVPPVPTITTTVPDGTKITVTWTMPSETNVTDYQLEYKKTTDSTWSRGAVVSAPTKTYAVSGLVSLTSYDIRVRAAYVNNAGTFSTPATATTTTPVILWNDTFTDTDGTSILLHTADSGGTYQRQTGSSPSNDASMQSNKLRPRSSAGIYRTATAMLINNYEVQATLSILSEDTGSVGVTARASISENTFYAWRYQRLSSTTADLRLIKVINGVITTLTTVNIPVYTTGQSFTLKLSVNDNTLIGFVDDVPISNINDNSITSAGCAGLRLLVAAGINSHIHVDNFIVREG